MFLEENDVFEEQNEIIQFEKSNRNKEIESSPKKGRPRWAKRGVPVGRREGNFHE